MTMMREEESAAAAAAEGRAAAICCGLLAIAPISQESVNEAAAAATEVVQVPVWPRDCKLEIALPRLPQGQQSALAYGLAQKLARLADVGHCVAKDADMMSHLWVVVGGSGGGAAVGTVGGIDIWYAGRLDLNAVARYQSRVQELQGRTTEQTWVLARGLALVTSLWRLLSSNKGPSSPLTKVLKGMLTCVRFPRDVWQLLTDVPETVVTPDQRLLPPAEESCCQVLGVALVGLWSSAATPSGSREYLSLKEADALLADTPEPDDATMSCYVVTPVPPDLFTSPSFVKLLEVAHEHWRQEALRRRAMLRVNEFLLPERSLEAIMRTPPGKERVRALERAGAYAHQPLNGHFLREVEALGRLAPRELFRGEAPAIRNFLEDAKKDHCRMLPAWRLMISGG